MSALQLLRALQSPAQFLAYFAEFQPGRSLFGDDVIIRQQEQSLILPVKFPYQPLQAISRYRIADLAADGNADTDRWHGGLLPENKEIGCVDLLPLAGKPQKIPPFQEPLMPGKTGHGFGPYLVAMVTASRLRPLARLLLMTSRPFLVDMRTRKPWVLFRDVLLG